MSVENTGLWVLAMNSTRARIVRGIDADDLTGQTELVMRTDARKLRDVLADRPIAGFSPDQAGRWPVKGSRGDPLQEDEGDFIRQIIAMLESHRRAGDFNALAVFAQPDVLGRLRQMFPQSLREKVVREVPKNVLYLSPRDLPGAIARDLGHDRAVH